MCLFYSLLSLIPYFLWVTSQGEVWKQGETIYLHSCFFCVCVWSHISLEHFPWWSYSIFRTHSSAKNNCTAIWLTFNSYIFRVSICNQGTLLSSKIISHKGINLWTFYKTRRTIPLSWIWAHLLLICDYSYMAFPWRVVSSLGSTPHNSKNLSAKLNQGTLCHLLAILLRKRHQ